MPKLRRIIRVTLALHIRCIEGWNKLHFLMFSFTIGSPGLSCSPMMDELYICVLILLLMQSVNKQYADVPLIQFH